VRALIEPQIVIEGIGMDQDQGRAVALGLEPDVGRWRGLGHWAIRLELSESRYLKPT
jgi:hypothetical protein